MLAVEEMAASVREEGIPMHTDGGTNFEYREREVRVEVSGAGEAFSGRANLLRKGEHKCRLVLSTMRLDATAARLAWARKSPRLP